MDVDRGELAARLLAPLGELSDDDARTLTEALPALTRLAGVRVESRAGGRP